MVLCNCSVFRITTEPGFIFSSVFYSRHTYCVHVLLAIFAFSSLFGAQDPQMNVALNKSTWQSQQYNPGDSTFHSSNAVDGLKSDLSAWGGQCVISSSGYRTATWWVNLASIYSIHDIRIYYRTKNKVWDASNGYTARFLGFSVYVSNTTNRLDGYLCFHDTNYTRSTIPAVVNITCPVHGQYVIYYNERLSNVDYPDGYSIYAFNELCEMEVYGCRAGYYESNCSLQCPDNCRYCHIEAGVCSWCKPGYRGYECEFECDGGGYGQDCGERCGACLGYKQCHHINGSCLEGCDAGYEGGRCETECSGGKFGNNCRSDCSAKCGVPNRCNRTTGVCDGGCQTGWEGPQCKKECNGGTYGQDCGQSCGACLGYKQCHHINGSCLEGCDAGYRGDLCEKVCSVGKFGNSCTENCSINCAVPNRCNRTTGECKGGCLPGWEGIVCDKVYTEEKSDWPSRFYVILAAFSVSVAANAVFIAYFCLKWRRKETGMPQTMKEICNPVQSKSNDVYENSEGNITGEYQELGELEKPSHYDALR